jgi:hypothetical protein
MKIHNIQFILAKNLEACTVDRKIFVALTLSVRIARSQGPKFD